MLPLGTHFRTLSICMALGLATLLSACSGSSDSPTGVTTLGTVKLEAVLSGSSVHSAAKHSGSPSTSGAVTTVDSISVDKVQVLLSRTALKLDQFGSSEGSTNVRNSARVVEAVVGSPIWYAQGGVPNGTYTHLTFEMTRLTAADTAEASYYGPFMTPDFPSLKVMGTLYRDGESIPFEWHSDVISSMEVKLDPTVVIAAGTERTVVLTIDPSALFVHDGNVLDPTDETNKEAIDASVADMFSSAAER